MKKERKRKNGIMEEWKKQKEMSYIPVRKKKLCNAGKPGMAGDAGEEAKKAAVMNQV